MTNLDIKVYLSRAMNIENELDTLKEDKKELNKEMKENGVDGKAFAIALKELRKPIDKATKDKANEYLEANSQYSLFV